MESSPSEPAIFFEFSLERSFSNSGMYIGSMEKLGTMLDEEIQVSEGVLPVWMSEVENDSGAVTKQHKCILQLSRC